jgi:hypothetical protein
LAVVFPVGAGIDLAEHDLVPIVAGVAKPVFPAFACFKFLAHFLLELRILNTAEKFLWAFGRMPRMNKRREA